MLSFINPDKINNDKSLKDCYTYYERYWLKAKKKR